MSNIYLRVTQQYEKRCGGEGMPDSYKTIFEAGRAEFVISRSRFIGWSKPAATEDAALQFIEDVRKNHWEATHNVWAYVLGDGRERFSDDGEPQGTAGLPVLEVLRKEGLREAAVVITRYFGGVKLGAGGLVRAYTRGAKAALDAGKIIERRPYLSRFLKTEYPLAGKLQRAFAQKGYVIKEVSWLDEVTFTVLIPLRESEALQRLTAELTAGRGGLQEGPLEYLDFYQGELLPGPQFR
jgi:uncharacterized YigZ family protein